MENRPLFIMTRQDRQRKLQILQFLTERPKTWKLIQEQNTIYDSVNDITFIVFTVVYF